MELPFQMIYSSLVKTLGKRCSREKSTAITPLVGIFSNLPSHMLYEEEIEGKIAVEIASV